MNKDYQNCYSSKNNCTSISAISELRYHVHIVQFFNENFTFLMNCQEKY